MESKQKVVLIVDDEPALLGVLVDKFTHEGFAATGAKDGQEGLKAALFSHPDLILLDIIMPVMEGMTMLENLRKDPWGKNVPVILLTNLSDSEKESLSRQKGVNDYLIKSDWKLEDVVKKVKTKIF